MIEWEKTSLKDVRLIALIVGRIMKLELTFGRQHVEVMMDMEATHISNPLRLQELLDSSEGDFTHDVVGIFNNIDRETGELKNCFVPRFTA